MPRRSSFRWVLFGSAVAVMVAVAGAVAGAGAPPGCSQRRRRGAGGRELSLHLLATQG